MREEIEIRSFAGIAFPKSEGDTGRGLSLKTPATAVTCHTTGDGAPDMDDAVLVEADAGVERTADLLGGQRALRRRVRNRLDAHDLLREGLPGDALRHLVDGVGMFRGAQHDSLEKAIGMGHRTLQRRKEKPAKPLNAEQSGRAWKFAEILGRASELFGSQAEAEQWLQTPTMALDQRKPIDLLSTPAGVEMIEDHLGRLEHGVYT